jgi:hypothetical protein
MMRVLAYRATLVGAPILLLVLTFQLISQRGPIEMRAPASVVSNSHPAQRGLEPYLLFLADVRRRIPPGASVAVLGPDSTFLAGNFDYLVAFGQLPQNVVEPMQSVLDQNRRAPRYFASYRREFSDERYRALESIPSGYLYELRQ